MSIYKKYYYLKYQTPTTPSKRHKKILNIKTNIPLRNHKFRNIFPVSSGRNQTGKISIWHRGGGHKQFFRKIDFLSLNNSYHKLVHIEYDPIRSCLIGLFLSVDGTLSYRILPIYFKIGNILKTLNFFFLKHTKSTREKNHFLHETKLSRGDTMPMFFFPNGSFIHNIELYPYQGAQINRAAGTKGKILARLENGYVLVQLKTKEIRYLSARSKASLGYLSNYWTHAIRFGKAGRSRWLNIRPTVRGVAMNPIDHPHGGGQGKSKGGHFPVTPWGLLTKGTRTRTNKVSFIKFTRKFIPKKESEK